MGVDLNFDDVIIIVIYHVINEGWFNKFYYENEKTGFTLLLVVTRVDYDLPHFNFNYLITVLFQWIDEYYF